MRKVILVVLAFIILVACLLAYLHQTEEKVPSRNEQTPAEQTKKDVREAVWGQLSARQKEEIDGTWRDGKVSKTTLKDNGSISPVGDKSYVGQEVYLISFPSKRAATLGEVIVYADVNTFDIIGYGLRD